MTDRKAVAKETLDIMRNGYYDMPSGTGKRIDLKADMEQSVRQSVLITPEQGTELLMKYEKEQKEKGEHLNCKQQRVCNLSTVDAIRLLAGEGKTHIGVLNFASAKNPGGGFLNGAMAQEESLAASSTRYRTLTAHEEYYRENRSQKSMMYTEHGIYSPDVLFFRDGGFRLAEDPVRASVLTLPAVNMGQVIQKHEDVRQAEQVMKRRMKLALAVFADHGDRNLILGAYGCGVFRNDPVLIAKWWKELLEEGFDCYFESVFHAVLDRSQNQACIRAFERIMK